MKKNKSENQDSAPATVDFSHVKLERLLEVLPAHRGGRFADIKFDLGKSLGQLKEGRFEIVNVANLDEKEISALRTSIGNFIHSRWPDFTQRYNHQEKIIIVVRTADLKAVRGGK